MSDKPQEEQIGLIALDAQQALRDELSHAVDKTVMETAEARDELTVAQANLVYQMLMAGLVSRLFLYLYGELDRIRVEMVCEAIEEHRLENRHNVYTEIVERGVGPLRAVYEHLIAEGLIEREELGVEANAHLDQQDKIQSRVVVEVVATTYSVPTEINVTSTDPLVSNLAQDWAKIELNGNIPPGTASRYTLLYKPPSELGE